MKARILALLGVPVAVGGVAAGGWVLKQGGLIPAFLWPLVLSWLVFLGLLILTGLAFAFGARRWLAVPGAGTLAQLVGTLLLWGGAVESHGGVLLWMLATMALVTFILFCIWVVSTVRARSLEQQIVEGMGGSAGSDPQKLAEIRKNMLETLTLLKRAGLGRNAIYELPWFLVIGRSQAGKTVAIKNSGLGLPVKRDRVKGVGGTHTCDWFFTNDLIFLDTPGAWVTEGAGEEGQKTWAELLRLLRRYRGRRPLDGLVVVVPADDLLSKSEQDLEEQAANIRQVVDVLQDELRFRFPVYVLVSKCDLVEGFVEFFRQLPAQRRGEIVGWSNLDPNRGDPPRLITRGFQRVLRRLEAYRLEMMARIASVTKGRRLFFFTEEFKNLERPLGVFASVLFEADAYRERPVFRGFYFTSGTQGEGTPMAQAMAQLAQALGVRVAQAQAAGEEEPKRGYFLLELFRSLMLEDRGLVGRTAVHWWRSRRDSMIWRVAPAGLAVLLLFMSGCSLLLNSRTYENMQRDVPQIVRGLEDLRHDAASWWVEDALERTGALRAYHRQLTGFDPLRSFGWMRQPGRLADQSFRLFRERFVEAVLRPTLQEAERYATDPERPCTERMDVFYSVVYLRRGHRGEWADDLRGLEKVWGLQADRAEEARSRLIQQFTYLTERSRPGESLLPGISLVKVARSIVAECREKGPESALDHYQRFQEECRQLASDDQTVRCGDRLNRILRFPREDYERFRRHLEGLREDLVALRDDEPEAQASLELIETVPPPAPITKQCLIEFNETVVPAVERYVVQDDLVKECNRRWKEAGRRNREAASVVKEQEPGLKEGKDRLFEIMERFNSRCEDQFTPPVRLDSSRLASFAYEFRFARCIEAKPVAIPPPIRPPTSLPVEGPKPPAPPRPSALSLLSASVARPGLALSEWEQRKARWRDDLEMADAHPEPRRQREIALVIEEVEEYARRYAEAWKRYLDGLTVRERRGAAAGWLESLATSGEYRRMLQPAADAVPVAAEADPRFDILRQQMDGLRSLQEFVAQDLGAYQETLGRIAKDLKECEKTSSFWVRYRQQIAGRDPGNTLVAARNWIEEHAGMSLAGGRLKKLFLEPLEEARNILESPSLTAEHWDDLLGLYEATSSRVPFAGQGADELAAPGDLVALLGGRSGIVPAIHKLSADRPISPAAKEWLARGFRLSRSLFKEGEDEPRPLRLTVTLGKPAFEPGEIEEKYRIEKIQVHLGKEAEFEWKEPDPTTEKLAFPLFGDDASEYSRVAASVSRRKGVVGRTFGSDYKEAEMLVAVQVKGAWAPLRLLAQGARSLEGNSASLVYELQVEHKKDKPGRIRIPIEVEAEGLGLLLDAAREGLGGPPASLE